MSRIQQPAGLLADAVLSDHAGRAGAGGGEADLPIVGEVDQLELPHVLERMQERGEVDLGRAQQVGDGLGAAGDQGVEDFRGDVIRLIAASNRFTVCFFLPLPK